MKSPSVIIGCLSTLFVLFAAELCMADFGCLSLIGNSLAMADVNEQSTVPVCDDVLNANTLGNPKENGLNKSSKPHDASNDFSGMDVSGPQMAMVDSAGNSRGVIETADSPFQHYLLVVLLGSAAGLVLVAAGAAQWWRRRSISQYWLFPSVLDDGESATQAVSLPAQLIAKKQLEESAIDPDTKMHTQRRAA
jgi:hypothetical protein